MTAEAHRCASVAIDLLVEAGRWPPADELEALARRTVDAVWDEIGDPDRAGAELSLLFSDDAKVHSLNAAWRGEDKATNVLAFPAFSDRHGGRPPLLGDVVLAQETVAAEAAAEGKSFSDHLCHLIVHGVLHLIGYDHQDDAQAGRMEDLEKRVLARLGIPDPYR